MDVEIIDKRLVVTPTTHDDVRLIYAIAAALAFYMKTEPTVIHCPAAEKYEQVAVNVQCVMDELP